VIKATFRNVVALAVLVLAFCLSIPNALAVTTGTIRGTITSDSGTPLSGVIVRLYSAGGTSAVDNTKTDSQGIYTFTFVQPGNFIVSADIVGYAIQKAPVNVSQEGVSLLDFSLSLTTTKIGVTTVHAPPISRTESGAAFTVNQAYANKVTSDPLSSDQFPGLVTGVPGITFDPEGGYPHIRGSDENQVGYQIDGTSIVSADSNQFSTNIVSIGLKTANVEEGGEGAEYGGSLGGAINLVTKDGRDLLSDGHLVGGTIESTLGPGHGWDYSESADELGAATADGKFDFYATTIVFRNHFPGSLSNSYAYNLPDSYDGLYKINYYMDKADQFTAYYGRGNEEYQFGPGNDQYEFDRDTDNGHTYTNTYLEHEMQAYKDGYFGYKHKFGSNAVLTARVDNQPEFIEVNEGTNAPGEEGLYEGISTDHTTNDLQFSDIISKSYSFNTGYTYTPEHDYLREVEGDFSAPWQGGNDYEEFDHNTQLDRNALYMNNQYKPFGDKLTFNIGARDEQLKYDTTRTGTFTKRASDPRLGAVYSPSKTFLLRTSYGTTSQFADTDRIEYESATQAGFSPTYTDPAGYNTFIESLYGATKPNPARSKNFDLGIENSFVTQGNPGFLGGQYKVTLTGYRRIEGDLLQRDRTLVDEGGGTIGATGPRDYDAVGTGHSQGVEFKFEKDGRKPYDLDGFVSYTNQHVTATSTFFDTRYVPYYYGAAYGVAGVGLAAFNAGIHTEYPTTYDQKHTVYAEITKKANKLITFNANLDAGSGYPYQLGVSTAASTVNAANVGPTFDAQHVAGTFLSGGAAVFNTVPIVLPDMHTLQPLNVVPGRTGWHYKITLNTDFTVSKKTTLFFNVDNLFDKQTALLLAPVNGFGTEFYSAPSAAYPQGRVYYGAQDSEFPVFVSFGFRTKF
jgi:hypothetical protein